MYVLLVLLENRISRSFDSFLLFAVLVRFFVAFDKRRYKISFHYSQYLYIKFTKPILLKTQFHVLLNPKFMNKSNTTVQSTLQIIRIYTSQQFQFMSIASKIEKREKNDRNQFRVKFTANEQKKTIINNKEMILGARPRTLRDINSLTSGTAIKSREVDSESEVESQTSKRELRIDSLISPKAIEYTQNNTSLIISSFDVLNNFFDDQVAFKLIFRASNHKFNVKAFHQICDSYEDTITICLTEDNKIIGGYTPLSWEDQYSKNSTHFKTDFKRETFLFSVTDNAKYPLVKSLKNKAICCFKGYGPTFGGGYDLLIGDKTNQLPNTTSYFPRNFQHPNPNNFNKRQFTGTSRKHFKLQEWEVFHVIRIHSLKTIQNVNFTQPNVMTQLRPQKTLFERFKIAAKDLFTSLFND